MKDVINIYKSGALDFSDPKIKAAYALNLCTVSVSQIIDYNDVVILEQEYEAILNNLNIEQMPKDEALLHILKQLLDTITFFRIQEVDKQFVDRDYQNKMKNAIWNAVPSLGLIVAGGNLVTTAISLASQVGVAYINYRKAKAENAYEYEKEMWQLHRAAIEQFNGLRRELFDTAWRLVDAYELPDEYRLTENQVKQYNNILMDSDVLRRFERLNTIQDAFIAYPPFWYFFGNTANELSRRYTGETSEYYRNIAKQYYQLFIDLFRSCDLLRENQVASAAALEYIDLLTDDLATNKDLISDLLAFAIKMSGGANDVMQLCALAYLKIGDSPNAATTLRRLVNEDYNTVVNAQLLSALYVHQFMSGDNTAGREYLYLKERIDDKYLFPFPQGQLLIEPDSTSVLDVQRQFIDNQKEILTQKFGIVINLFQEKYRTLFNKCVPVPEGKEYTDDYYNGSSSSFAARKADGVLLKSKKAISRYVGELLDSDYPYNYLPVLNDMMNDVTMLNCVQSSEHALLISLSTAIISIREQLKHIRSKIEDGTKFTIDTYNELLEISFDKITKDFFNTLIQSSSEYIAHKDDVLAMNEAEMNLTDFCNYLGFKSPEELYQTNNDVGRASQITKQYLGVELIDDGILTEVVTDRFNEIKDIILRQRGFVCADESSSKLLLFNEEEFDRYFIRANLPDKYDIRRKTVAVLDDLSEKDKDLLFTTDGIMQVIKGKMKDVVLYDDIELNNNKTALVLHQPYINENINMQALITMVGAMRTTPYEINKANPFDVLAKILKR
ncbi:MAG: hypothetical protein IJF87_08985 [Erysipelotrichaceae bacterium]|nr:hypothetical protein [Erysipelotrichaceae bacterium]